MSILNIMTCPSNARYGKPSTMNDTTLRFGEARAFYTGSGGTSSSSRFDNRYASGYFYASTQLGEPVLDLGANYTDFWLHFDMYVPISTSGTNQLIQMFSETGRSQHCWHFTSGNNQWRKSTTNNTFAGTQIGSNLSGISTNTRATYDIHIKIAASGGIVDIWQNGSSILSFSGDTSTNGVVQAVRYIKFSGDLTSVSFYRAFSQIIAADEDTRGWFTQDLIPSSGGSPTFTGWTGDYTDVAQLTESLTQHFYLNTNTPNATHTFNTPDIHSNFSALQVKGLMVSGRAFAQPGSAVDEFEVGMEIGGVWYPGTSVSVPPGDGDVFSRQWFLTNPATSGAWSQSAVNSILQGIKAKA